MSQDLSSAAVVIGALRVKQGDSDSEVICFVPKFKLSVDLIQLLKCIMLLGFTLQVTSLSYY